MNGFLLDTNVISELVKPQPAPTIRSWIDSVDPHRLFLSVMTLGEIRKGIEALPPSRKRIDIDTWLEEKLKPQFEGRILPISSDIADAWGILSGQAHSRKTRLPVIDTLLAATALRHGLTLVTRNTTDFVSCGVPLFNPWIP